MPTKLKPIEVTCVSSKLSDVLIEVWDYFVEHPHLKVEWLSLVSFKLLGQKKWKMRFKVKQED